MPATIHLLLDGRVTATSRTTTPRSIDPPSALGFAEALQGQPMAETVRTTDIAVTLALTAEELRALLSDNADLVTGLFATLAESVSSPDVPVHPTGAATELQQIATGGLSAIDKVLALQRIPIFSRVSADEMRHLANIALAVEMLQGSVLFPESATPALWLVLAGEVSLNGGAPVTASAGDIIGSVFTMAGRSLDRTAAVRKSGMALKIDHDELFDMLGERPELLRQMFAGMFKIRGTSLLDQSGVQAKVQTGVQT